jgi:hypothetical protein
MITIANIFFPGKDKQFAKPVSMRMTIFQTVLVNIYFVLTHKPIMFTIAKDIRTYKDFQLIAQEQIYILRDWVHLSQLSILISSVKKNLHNTLDHSPYKCTITFVSGNVLFVNRLLYKGARGSVVG